MSKTKAVTRAPEPLAFDESAEVEVTNQVGAGLKAFVASVVPFMRRAAQLEANAAKTLAVAEAIVPPKTEAADVALQDFVKRANADKKTIEEHWTITSVLFNFQRRLVALRTRATEKLDRAASIGNRLHNEYVEAERRRAREEEDRQRREKELAETQRREREARRLEEEALKAEAASEKLSAREMEFVAAYHLGKPGTLAAKAAGFQNPEKTADRLLATKKITDAIESLERVKALRAQAEAVKEQPIEVEVAPVRPAVSRAPGAHDRTTYAADVLDVQAFVDACLDGTVPREVARVCLTAVPAALNQQARSLRAEINAWPGVRLKKTTGVV